MRLLLIALVVAALVAPTAVLAGATSGGQGSPAGVADQAAKKKTAKHKQKRKHAKKRTAKQLAAAKARLKAKSGVSRAGDEREVKGTITALGSGSITVGTLTCAVPASVAVSGFAVGDRVEVTCDLVGGVWTLRKLHREDAADDEREVKGKITALGSGSITVGTTTCQVPVGMKLAGFAVGDLVELKCDLVGAVWVVREVESEDDHHSGKSDDDDDDDDDHDSSGKSDDDDDDDDDDDRSGSGGDDD